MANPVYKSIEITGTSGSSIEEAVGRALKKASESVRNLRWFEVTDIRGSIDGTAPGEWQVTTKIGFTLED